MPLSGNGPTVLDFVHGETVHLLAPRATSGGSSVEERSALALPASAHRMASDDPRAVSCSRALPISVRPHRSNFPGDLAGATLIL